MKNLFFIFCFLHSIAVLGQTGTYIDSDLPSTAPKKIEIKQTDAQTFRAEADETAEYFSTEKVKPGTVLVLTGKYTQQIDRDTHDTKVGFALWFKDKSLCKIGKLVLSADNPSSIELYGYNSETGYAKLYPDISTVVEITITKKEGDMVTGQVKTETMFATFQNVKLQALK